MAERLSLGDKMVEGEVQWALHDQVVVQKQVWIVGNLFVRRLRKFIDAFQVRGMDRQFGVDLVRVAWHGIGGMRIYMLRCSSRDFVNDKMSGDWNSASHGQQHGHSWAYRCCSAAQRGVCYHASGSYGMHKSSHMCSTAPQEPQACVSPYLQWKHEHTLYSWLSM